MAALISRWMHFVGYRGNQGCKPKTIFLGVSFTEWIEVDFYIVSA